MYVSALFWTDILMFLFPFCAFFSHHQSFTIQKHQAVPSLHLASPARFGIIPAGFLSNPQVGSRHSSLCHRQFHTFLRKMRFQAHTEALFPPGIVFAQKKGVLCKHEQIGILQILGEDTETRKPRQSWQRRSYDRTILNSEITMEKSEYKKNLWSLRHDSRTISRVETSKCPKKCCYPQMNQALEIWVFPKIGVPPNHPF